MLRLTRLRTERGWSKSALSRAANIDQGLVSKIESGRVIPYKCQLDRLAAALGVPADEASSLLFLEMDADGRAKGR